MAFAMVGVLVIRKRAKSSAEMGWFICESVGAEAQIAKRMREKVKNKGGETVAGGLPIGILSRTACPMV